MSQPHASPATAMVRALLAGQKAAEDRRPVTDCPYQPGADTAEERVLATMWLRGHARVTPPPVDYSG